MNLEKLQGVLLKGSGTVDLHPPSRVLGSPGVNGRQTVREGRPGGVLVEVPLGERALTHHALLPDEEDELGGAPLPTHDLIPHDELMVQEETVKNDAEEDPELSQRLSHRPPYTLHLPVSQEQRESSYLCVDV